MSSDLAGRSEERYHSRTSIDYEISRINGNKADCGKFQGHNPPSVDGAMKFSVDSMGRTSIGVSLTTPVWQRDGMDE